MPELHQGNTYVGVQIGNNPTDMSLHLSEGNVCIHATSTRSERYTQCAGRQRGLDAAHANPSISTHWIAYESGFSPSAVWRRMLEEQMYSFHVQLVQEL
jgi:hypothetical protein